MRALANWQFDASLPLQTKRGTKQTLRCGDDKLEDLIERGLLDIVYIGRSPRITTASIMKVASTGTQVATMRAINPAEASESPATLLLACVQEGRTAI